MTGTGLALLEFTENVLGMEIGEAAKLADTHPSAMRSRLGDVYQALADTWCGQTLEELRGLEGPGELWPVSSPDTGDALDVARRKYQAFLGADDSNRPQAGAVAARTLLQTQGLLLYAHGLYTPNPFQKLRPIHATGVERDFLVIVAEIARLAPLLRAGVIEVFEPAPEPTEAQPNLVNGPDWFREAHRDVSRLFVAADACTEEEAVGVANVVIDRIVWQLRLLVSDPDGLSPTLVFDSAAERRAFEVVADIAGSVALASGDPNAVRLAQLVDLRLPGLADLRLADMVSIRTDTAFAEFRSDMGLALLAADDLLAAGKIVEAQQVVQEHMAAGAARLERGSRRGRIGEALSTNALGWAIGAALADSLAGLRAAIAAMLGALTVDLATGPSRSQRALRAHYVALSVGAKAGPTGS